MKADPVKLAVNHALRVKELVDELNDRNTYGGAGFRRRARDFPSLVAAAGLTPALLFYLSKARSDKIEEALEVMKGAKLTGDKLEILKDEVSNKEGAGYSLMLAAVIDAAEKLAGENLLASGEGDAASRLASGIVKLREKPGAEVKLVRLLEPYFIELKKIADALFKEDEE